MRLFTLVSVLALLPLSAFGADVAGKKPYFSKEPAVQWQGLYVGKTIGYGVSKVSSKDVASKSFNMKGMSGSLIAGYNWVRGPWVYGLEGDIGIHEIKGKMAPIAGLAGHEGDNLWNASLKGRAGYAFGRYLPFVSAGVTYGQLHLHNYPGTFYFGDVKHVAGWSAGAGLDAHLWGNFKGRIEYQYSDFGRQNFNLVTSTVRSQLSTHLVRVGLIYQPNGKQGLFPLKGDTSDGDWSGRYVGAATAFRHLNVSTQNPAGVKENWDNAGMLGGIYGGYNWQWDKWVAGFDSELFLSSVGGDKGAAGLPAMHYAEMWSSAFRGRIGYSYGALLPYIHVGVGLNQSEQNVYATGSTAVEPQRYWGVGAGVDYKFMKNVSARLEYAYSRSMQNSNPGLDAVKYKTSSDGHTVKLGVAYHFGK